MRLQHFVSSVEVTAAIPHRHRGEPVPTANCNITLQVSLPFRSATHRSRRDNVTLPLEPSYGAIRRPSADGGKAGFTGPIKRALQSDARCATGPPGTPTGRVLQSRPCYRSRHGFTERQFTLTVFSGPQITTHHPCRMRTWAQPNADTGRPAAPRLQVSLWVATPAGIESRPHIQARSAHAAYRRQSRQALVIEANAQGNKQFISHVMPAASVSVIIPPMRTGHREDDFHDSHGSTKPGLPRDSFIRAARDSAWNSRGRVSC